MKRATATITRNRTTTAIAICPPRLTPAPPPPPPAPAELPVVTAVDAFDVTDALSGGFVVAAAVDVVDAVVAFTDLAAPLVEVLLTTLDTFVGAATSAAVEVVLGLVVVAAAVELCSAEVASTETEVSSLSVGVGVVGGATVKLLVATVVLLLGAAELEAVE